jgi:hypothetical protein
MAAKGAPNDDKLLAELELVQSQVEKVENISLSSKNDALTHRPYCHFSWQKSVLKVFWSFHSINNFNSNLIVIMSTTMSKFNF